MNCHKISYCNSNGFLIKNNRSKFDIIDNIKNRLGYDFLNPIVKSYSDRLLPVIKKNNLLCTYLTTGKNVYMFLTRIYNENICLIIELEINQNNKFPKIISIPCNFSDELFKNNTLFYGEVYRDFKKKWFFLIEDIKMYKNKPFKNNIYNNLKLVNSIVKNNYKYLSISPFIVKVKKYFPLKSIKENIDNLNLNLKGVKFMGLQNPICFYFITNFYNKNKNNILELPRINHNLDIAKNSIIEDYINNSEIDLEIIENLLSYNEKEYYLELRKSKIYSIYNLYAAKNKELSKVGIARVDSIEMSVELLKILSNLDAIIVKVKLDKNFKKFTVLKIVKKAQISNYNDIKNELDIINKFPLPNYINC